MSRDHSEYLLGGGKGSGNHIDDISAAVEEVAKQELDAQYVPTRGGKDNNVEDVQQSSSDEESDDEKDVLDVMKERQYGPRRSNRKRTQPPVTGYLLNSSQIALSEDSEA